MPAFDYKQALEVKSAFEKFGVCYLFLGKSGAIILGFPDTTQDVDLFVKKDQKNTSSILLALDELGFSLSESDQEEILRGKDFIQLKNGPFDLDLIFAPDGLDSFEQAWLRRLEVEGFPVCHIEDIIKSKKAANRQKDKESLPRLELFLEYWKSKNSS